MNHKTQRDHILTPEQLRRMRAADQHWRDQRDKRAEMRVNEGENGPEVASERP
jgi:hypothetical protein